MTSGLIVGPFTVELRVYHPERREVAFVTMQGINRGDCINRAANRWDGWVVTDASEPVELGAPADHFWDGECLTCVKCGIKEHMAVDEDCSGVFQVF